MSEISASFPDSHSRFSHLTSSLFSQPSGSLSSFRSHDMTPTPASPTRPSPNDLQSHLYASFLQRKTADVALRISGSWNAVYRLHRVILIQAVSRTVFIRQLKRVYVRYDRATFSLSSPRASVNPKPSTLAIVGTRNTLILYSMT